MFWGKNVDCLDYHGQIFIENKCQNTGSLLPIEVARNYTRKWNIDFSTIFNVFNNLSSK